MIRIFSLMLFVILAAVPVTQAEETVIVKDTVWAGEVVIDGDVLILPGATLTIEPGTVIGVVPSESTKTEPEFISSYTEITVRGNLKAVGTKDMPVIFKPVKSKEEKQWAGIIIDGGSAALSWCWIDSAESGLTVFAGEAKANDSIFDNNRYGISVLTKEAKVQVERTEFKGNDYGMVLLNGAEVVSVDNKFIKSKQTDVHAPPAGDFALEAKEYIAQTYDKDAPYQSESLLGTVVWKDRVTVNGVIRIPATSRLIIMPGTVVEFTKNDTNGDGIGENGLLVMGMLVAKGTKDAPIVFRSAEKDKKMADWDAINIYTSDGFQNILEYVQIEDAYRGVHIHFSNVLITNSIFKNNFRGLQFQESLVEVRKTDIFGNKHAMRARDSELSFTENRVFNNYAGPNLFRIIGQVKDNVFAGNLMDGLRVREGAFDVEKNYMLGNRYGLTVAYANYGSFSKNVLAANYEIGLVSKGTDNIAISENFIQANGGNGISLLNSRADIRGNHIAENGERGIGIISFTGKIDGNNLVNNKLYGIGLDGENDIFAPSNWWGGATDIEAIIFDKNDDPKLGRIDYELPLEEPVPFVWPVESVLTDTIWQGVFHLPTKIVKTSPGTTLTIAPGSVVKLGKDTILWLDGKIKAMGKPDKRILFTALEKTEGVYWDQMTTEKSTAEYDYCDFENANMGLHSHFSNVTVTNCRFFKNDSGFRFRGGPVEIHNSTFTENVYGIVSYFAKAKISNNLFTRNDMGILVRAERRGGVEIKHNNIVDNTRYNLRIGDFNKGEDVDATDNWWGEIEPGSMIFDERFEPGIGVVHYDPWAKKPFEVKN